MAKEIGSNFELSYTTGKGDCHTLKNSERTIYLRSARECLFFIALEAKKNNVKNVFLPALCCSSMIQPFEELGFFVRFYKITPELSVDEKYLRDILVDDSILLIMNYYSIRSYGNIKSIINGKKNIISIQDCTQHIFTPDLYDKNFDYCVGSIRKWVAIPDGAFIYSNKACIADLSDVVETDDGYVELSFSCMRQKSEYLLYNDIKLKESFREKYYLLMRWLRNKIIMHQMSNLSRQIYNDDINIRDVITKRYDNYTYLVSRLFKKYPSIVKYCTNQKCPMCVPLVVNNRDFIQSELAKMGVYCQVLWPLEPNNAEVCKNSRVFADSILAVPCDQRYSMEDMEYIFKCIDGILLNSDCL